MCDVDCGGLIEDHGGSALENKSKREAVDVVLIDMLFESHDQLVT